MKNFLFEIKPKVGFGELNFTDDSEKVIEYLGTPEEVERLEEDDTFNTVVMNYWDKGVSVFFEGIDKSVLSCFETDNENSVLFGEKVFSMQIDDVIKLMSENNCGEYEIEDEEEGEKRLSFDDVMIDFFFQNDKLCLVNWGVLVNEEGNIGL